MELQTSPSKQRRYKEAKLNLERTPQKATRVDIGFAFPRWTALRRDRCFQSDAELASFLLDSYERGAATPSSMNGKPAVSEFDASRGTERRLYSKDTSGVSEKKSFRPQEPRDQRFVSPTRAESEEIVQTHVRRSLVFPAEDQQDQQDPVLLHIKEEQEELLTSQDGEQLNGLEEADNTSLPFSAVIVKSEDDEEKPQYSQLYQSQIEDDREAECQISCATKIKTETDGEDCGGAEPTRNPASNNLSQQNTDAKTSVSCETEVSIGADDEGSGNDTDDWQEPLTESESETEDSDSGCLESRARAFACSECGKRFQYKWSLRRHMTDHSGKMSSSSFTNKKCFTVRQTADLQIKVHTGEKPYGCSLCGQRFRDQYNLKRHMRIHTGEKPFGCGVCGKRFNGEGNLKIHKRVHTGEKPFGCGVCGKKFKQKSHFKKHIMVHTEERPFSCDVCGKAFKWRIHMKTHMRIHSEEKLFGCDVCSRRFNCERNLKIHMRGHTDERPFGCDVCGRRFNCNRNLKIHKKVHTGERPFACGVCGKKFSQVGARNRHRSVHTEEKPFACELCGQRFNREGNLERHKRVHTGEKPFVCDVCGQKFTREGSLKRHMRNKAINHLHVVKDSQ